MTNGNGNGGDTSALARMWRSVYAKAAAVADARTTEQLKYHVYAYPHGVGGGAAGGWSLVEKVTVTSPTATVAFASVPTAGDALMLISRGSVTAPSGTNGAYYGLTLNGDPYPSGATTYKYVMQDVAGYPGAVATHATTGFDAFAYLGYFSASVSGTTTNDGGGISIAYLPDFTAAKRLNVLSDFQVYGTTIQYYGTAQVTGGRYSTVYDAHGPLTGLAVRCGNALQFDAGSTFALYVLTGTEGGGGGGGTADVTITTDASLTSTESPANTFALAARLSPDAGNALALHANGLYATGGGGGGMSDPTTTKGDLIARGAAAPATRLGVGTDGQVLTADAAQALGVRWATPTTGLADPLTTKGDLIARGTT